MGESQPATSVAACVVLALRALWTDLSTVRAFPILVIGESFLKVPAKRAEALIAHDFTARVLREIRAWEQANRRRMPRANVTEP
mmetsp:Transcript_16349/g.35502  ORF Transcript_16349/g.35502 Transcript_16349/m.35502 type:complete len:84 (+) Transcript_16349:1414-1665(+)